MHFRGDAGCFTFGVVGDKKAASLSYVLMAAFLFEVE